MSEDDPGYLTERERRQEREPGLFTLFFFVAVVVLAVWCMWPELMCLLGRRVCD